MSTSNTPVPESLYATDEMPRHSKEDALNGREYQLLLEGADRMREYYGNQARFIILVMGRLGMRRSELAHMREDWIDWRRNMIEIPRYEPCDMGKDGTICGSCRAAAQQKTEYNADVTFEEALRAAWHPKTKAAAREIPFDFDPRVALAIERFFDKYDAYPLSTQSINRRVKRAAEHSTVLDAEDVYPHCLRATAASYHSARGLDVIPLKALMGWSDLSTAQAYISSSGENTARALHQVHSM